MTVTSRTPLQSDLEQLPHLLQLALQESQDFLQALPEQAAHPGLSIPTPEPLSETGLGAEAALSRFIQRYRHTLSGSAGARYLGFVVGGSTPAALMGDWLVGAYDQNLSNETTGATAVEREALGWLRTLFGLSDAHKGSFVSGATMSNFVGLAIGRQWVAHQKGINAALEGLQGLNVQILSGAAHSSVFKAASMLGIGRKQIRQVALLPDREAVDISALETALQQMKGEPCIVVANSGTVNTVDFDDLNLIVALKERYNFFLHVDAAFGGFAACSPRHQHLVDGLNDADSITIDAHKWLNVPYDSAMQFTRHQFLQAEVFQNAGAAYLGTVTENPDFNHLTPENSRRFRALPAWMTLAAYGKQGYQEIIERNVESARNLGEKLGKTTPFELLAPVRLNVVCFTLKNASSMQDIQAFLHLLHQTGEVFMTPTVYQGRAAIRAAFSNWRTQDEDVERVFQALVQTAEKQNH
ncbi:pyridoxal phosphate-dependent decarboxylase family protein [Deinococcus cellulosilyticus]|uniref:Amino acid decarboxylase n=1 Tax=Deinococcus cellulosilyticus (strain DSM 18568 / NBRC 106333 / KACC 11606 / 5516J-15) TaxID=1223518 RepID=A0A511MV40_DEIC1|nr:pyridoxal-dependent decarboxylase [Deinococcus cellulosilyticus]GEM44454.1 amino acid decarboxylase [Deinococcus cellulosilyticus NBRC 106333 = KACC 11606]